jgi:hypothetical protein
MAMKVADKLSAVVAMVMLAQSTSGLLFRGQYRDVEWIAATWLGNDWVTLVVALPLLSAGIVLTRGRSVRGLLIWLGTLAYAIYNSAYYLLGAALNAFFPLYAVTVIVAGIALILALSGISPSGIARRFRAGTPTRLVGGYFVFVGLSLAAVWFGMWSAYVFAGRPTPIEPEAFKLVAALDTVLMVPTLAIGGILLWRRNAWGYIVSAIAGVQGSLYLLVLTINSSIAVARGLTEGPGEMPMWGGLAAMTTAATLLLVGNADGRMEA